MTEAVIARQLQKNYGSLQAVAGIDFSIESGRYFGILGPNGAGKTSTVAMIYCFLPVDGGELIVLGKNVHSQARWIKARLGVVPQENNLDLELSVLGNLLVYASYFGIEKNEARRRAEELLDFFGLSTKLDVEVDTLSGGMKRRLTIARGMMNKPAILVLDEPTTGLDPEARHHIWQHLKHLKQSGLTIILTTHYLEEASQLCDEIIIMDEGKILESGEPYALVTRHIGEQVLEAGIPESSRAALLDRAGSLLHGHLFIGGTAFLYPGKNMDSLAARVAEMPEVTYRLQRTANLEDVFLKLTGRGFSGG